MIRARATLPDNSALDVAFEAPTNCPICHHGIEPKLSATIFVRVNAGNEANELEVVFRCPREACERAFIARYKRSDVAGVNPNHPKWWTPSGLEPAKFVGRTFESSVAAAAPSFVKIYGQAEQAEHYQLSEICGPGYRKALEFLIKDYLKSIPSNVDSAESIEKMQLGPCIQSYVTDPRLKSTAQRAAWLGNDETHYVRRWEDKDVSDLKALINLTVHWVAAEILTRELEESMPATGPLEAAKAAE